MKKLISMLLVMAIIMPLVAVMPAKAAAPARTPIRSPYWDISAIIKEIVDQTGARNYSSDRDRIKAVYDWIIKNCDRTGYQDTVYIDVEALYARQESETASLKADLESGRAAMRTDFQYPYGGEFTTVYYQSHFGTEMALYRVGNCLHYAALLNLCLDELGYPTYIIAGDLISNGSPLEHKWNMTFIDGKPYWLDIRTDHASYESRGKISYNYFLKTDDAEWAKKHVEWYPEVTKYIRNQHAMGRAPYIYNNIDYTLVPARQWSKGSAWAENYLYQAQDAGLIPAVIQGADMTQNITREEFAALAVTLYEKQSGKTAEVAPVNPFNDTTSEDVLKAYNLGIVKGVALDHFAPTAPLTREQAATMLGRVHELIIKGKVGAGSGRDTSGATAFTDDNLIGSYATPYVYFMNANKILEGVGNGSFNPLGNTTRESAVKIAVTMWTNLK